MNKLYYGDNLDVLRKYIKDEKIQSFPKIEVININEILALKPFSVIK
jgi:hypothetical protein